MVQSFSSYLNENKNTHLEHLEDLVFNLGVDGIRQAIFFLRDLRNLLAGNTKSPVGLTVKWDGAPAIVTGTNPDNGKFFVATKGAFNKTPKLAYTAQDVDTLFGSGDLGNKLKIALEELPKLGIRGVIQGDFLFSQSDLKTITYNGEKLIAFRPNTITYAIVDNSNLAASIRKAKIGIVFHTTYVGTRFADLKATFGVDVASFKKTPSVLILDAMFKDESGQASLTSEETRHVTNLLSEIGTLFRQIDSSTIRTFVNNEVLKSHIKGFINHNVRAGSIKIHIPQLKSYLKMRFDKETADLKTEKGKQSRQVQLKKLLNDIDAVVPQLELWFRISELIASAKQILLTKLNKVSALNTFLETSDGLKVTAPEGFVAIDHLSGSAIKLVDRLEFSRANFNLLKNWR